MTAERFFRRLSDRAIIAATLAITFGVMAAGQSILRHGFGIAYGSESFRVAILPALVLMLALLFALGRAVKGAPADFGLARPSPQILRFLAIVALLGIGFPLWLTIGVPEGARADYLRRAAGLVLVMGFVAVAEEVAFRGFILAALDRLAGPIVAILGSALLFAAYHAVNVLGGRTLEDVAGQMLGSALLGAALGRVAWRCRSIAPAVVIHWLANVMLTVPSLAVSASQR